VKGYRLPTEAEWEYAARERGKQVRFGNGEDVARASEINFDAREGDSSYVETGEWRQNTVPVGSFNPNGLGLYDMSGNVWEWCSDHLRPYSDQNQINPYESTGARRAARGGRWGGGARELRVAARFGWASEDRCNNIGFRVARTP
jgi:formylglycine-generating enzyme required for sulfatase activity